MRHKTWYISFTEILCRNLGTTPLLYFKYWQTYLNTSANSRIHKKKKKKRKKRIRTTEWHHPSFTYTVKKELMSYFQKLPSMCSVKISALKNFANFTWKHLCWSFFLIKLQAFKAATLLKKDSNTDVFLWTLQNF